MHRREHPAAQGTGVPGAWISLIESMWPKKSGGQARKDTAYLKKRKPSVIFRQP